MSDTGNKDFAPTKDEAPAPTKTQGASDVTPKRKFSSRSTATAAQLARIIDALRISSKTTDDLRQLGIYQVSARVHYLRAAGYNIETTLFDGFAADGYSHARMARYTLLGDPEPAVCVSHADVSGQVALDMGVTDGERPQ